MEQRLQPPPHEVSPAASAAEIARLRARVIELEGLLSRLRGEVAEREVAYRLDALEKAAAAGRLRDEAEGLRAHVDALRTQTEEMAALHAEEMAARQAGAASLAEALRNLDAVRGELNVAQAAVSEATARLDVITRSRGFRVLGIVWEARAAWRSSPRAFGAYALRLILRSASALRARVNPPKQHP